MIGKKPKPITKKELAELAEEARVYVEEEMKIKSMSDLAPVFDPFLDKGISASNIFKFLLSKGIVGDNDFHSVSQAVYARNKERKKQI